MIWRWRCLIICCAIWCGANVWSADNSVENVRLWHSPDRTRVVFDVSADLRFSTFELSDPRRLVVDLRDTDLNVAIAPLADNQFIQAIRTGAPSEGVLRFVFELKQAITLGSFVLSPNELYGHRLVLDIAAEQVTVQEL